jgi:hypothetical protein
MDFYLCVHCGQDVDHFCIPELSFIPLLTHHTPPQGTGHPEFFHLSVFLALHFHINRIMHSVLFCVWLLSLLIVPENQPCVNASVAGSWLNLTACLSISLLMDI